MKEEKKKIQIEQFEDKIARSGKGYTRFKTDLGWLSAFEGDVIEELKQAVGKSASVGIASDGRFQNIRKIYKIDKPEVIKIEDKPASKPNRAFEKDPVGLCVEVFSSLAKLDIIDKKGQKLEMEAKMKLAIDVVKQAIKAF